MIRVNSQSGKAGVTSLLDQALSIKLPREMQVVFYKIVQKEAERTGKEVSIRTIVRLFRQTYRIGVERSLPSYVTLQSYRITNDHRRAMPHHESPATVTVEADIQCDGLTRTIQGSGSTPQHAFLSALSNALSVPMILLESQEHEIEPIPGQERPISSSKKATKTHTGDIASFAKISIPISMQQAFWGTGVADDPADAGIAAIVSAVNLGMDQLRPEASIDKREYPRIKNLPREQQKLMMMA